MAKVEKRKKFVMVAISGDEEKWVVGWCESIMKSNPDLVIINLTQYNDNSEELFRAGIPEDKLMLVKHPWQKSFSEARNHTMDLVPDDTDYVMFVDLDEIITPESYAPLEHVLHDPNFDMQVMINIYNAVSQESMLASLYYPRLFPWRDKDGTLLKPEFKGEVHNQLTYPPGVPQNAMRSQISLMHYGYALDSEAMTKKHKRSEELIRGQIAVDENDYFAHLNLAQLLRAKGDNEGTELHSNKVLKILAKRIESDDPRIAHGYIMAKEQLATAYLMMKRFDESIQASQDALDKKPDHLDSLMNLASANLEKRNMDKAEFWLKRYLFVRSQYDETKDNTNLILNHLNSTFIALYHLGTVQAYRGDLEGAKDYFFKCYKQEPTFADVFIRYLDCVRRIDGDKKIGQMVNDFITEHPPKAYQIYEYFGDLELENSNLENAKFNYYQSFHLSEKAAEHERIKMKWESISDAFGEVSHTFFDAEKKHQELKQRIG